MFWTIVGAILFVFVGLPLIIIAILGLLGASASLAIRFKPVLLQILLYSTACISGLCALNGINGTISNQPTRDYENYIEACSNFRTMSAYDCEKTAITIRKSSERSIQWQTLFGGIICIACISKIREKGKEKSQQCTQEKTIANQENVKYQHVQEANIVPTREEILGHPAVIIGVWVGAIVIGATVLLLITLPIIAKNNPGIFN